MGKEYHEAANIFPMMAGEEFSALKQDIAENGMREAIWLHPDGRIIDGRNRYRACEELGIAPVYRTWDGRGSLVSFVVSLNLHRRHLTSGQRAVIGLDILPMLEAEAQVKEYERKTTFQKFEKSNMEPVHAAQQAAQQVGVNRQYISDVKKIAQEAPELIAPMRTGEMSVPQAKQVLKVRHLKNEAARKVAEDIEHPPPTIYCADALEFMGGIADDSVDLLLTDPPYSTDVADIVSFVADWVPVALAKLKPTGRAYICIGAYPKELAAYLNVLNSQRKFVVDAPLIWTYRNTLGVTPHMKYNLNYQVVLHLYSATSRPLDTSITNEMFSVQDINAPDGRFGDRYHTWQKPDELARRLIKHATLPGDLVLDPFTCTGTFPLMAAHMGRKVMACDIDPVSLEIAQERGCHVELG